MLGGVTALPEAGAGDGERRQDRGSGTSRGGRGGEFSISSTDVRNPGLPSGDGR